MLRRIDWATEDDEDEARGPSDPPKRPNGCRLVWEGSVKVGSIGLWCVSRLWAQLDDLRLRCHFVAAG